MGPTILRRCLGSRGGPRAITSRCHRAQWATKPYSTFRFLEAPFLLSPCSFSAFFSHSICVSFAFFLDKFYHLPIDLRRAVPSHHGTRTFYFLFFLLQFGMRTHDRISM